MRVLFVLDTYALIGGTERYAGVVIPGLIERGHDVTVLCREGDGSGLPPVETIAVPELDGARLDDAGREALDAALDAAAPEVIYISAMRNIDALERMIDRAPTVRFVHDHTTFCPGLNKMYETGETCRHALGFRCLTRYWLDGGCVCFKPVMHANPVDAWKGLREKLREVKITRRAARVLTNSDYMRDQLVLAGFEADRTEVVHPFTAANTDAAERGPLPPELDAWLDPEKPLLLTPARLTLPDKGVDYLLTMLAELVAEGVPFQAVICGDGPAREWLREKATAEGLDGHVRITGWLASGPVETLFERATVVCCPSVWDEPFGLVGPEAMAHGKPVVAFDVGGVPDWLDPDVTGVLVPRRDTHAMANAVRALLDDAERRAAMGAAGVERVTRLFRGPKHLDGLQRAFEAAVS